jgi:PKD repeat protein
VIDFPYHCITLLSTLTHMTKHLLNILAFCGIVFTSTAQCPTCSPDFSCTSADGFPTVCPAELPVGQAGEYYEQVLTFYLPTDITDPSSGIEATLLQITITSVTGLPFGTTYTMNNPDGIYYPAQGENYGCATICGTPLLPGVYDVLINVAAIAEAFGFEVNQNESFTYTLIIEPGDVATGSFTADNIAGCGSLDVSLNALIAGTSNQVTTYAWDLGNGSTSDLANPMASFTGPGTYTVSLTTTISDYFLNNVTLDNINGNGEGDVDEFFSGPADPFFILQDANGNAVYTSSTVDNSTSASWTNLNIPLTNPPYTIVFWDEDDVSADDNLGSDEIAVQAGTVNFSSGDGTVGNVEIILVESTSITDATEITVFGVPNGETSVSGNIISANDPTVTEFVWGFNGFPIDGETSSSLAMTGGGLYQCEMSNEFGCSALSSPYLYCPTFTPEYDPIALEIYVDDIYTSYQWYYNGLEVPGGTTFYLIDPALGNYSVVVTTSYGCEIESDVLTIGVNVEEFNSFEALAIYPNPTNGVLNITINAMSSSHLLSIYNSQGQKVITEQYNHISASQIILDLSNLSDGVYSIVLNENGKRKVSRVVVQR